MRSVDLQREIFFVTIYPPSHYIVQLYVVKHHVRRRICHSCMTVCLRQEPRSRHCDAYLKHIWCASKAARHDVRSWTTWRQSSARRATIVFRIEPLHYHDRYQYRRTPAEEEAPVRKLDASKMSDGGATWDESKQHEKIWTAVWSGQCGHARAILVEGPGEAVADWPSPRAEVDKTAVARPRVTGSVTGRASRAKVSKRRKPPRRRRRLRHGTLSPEPRFTYRFLPECTIMETEGVRPREDAFKRAIAQVRKSTM